MSAHFAPYTWDRKEAYQYASLVQTIDKVDSVEVSRNHDGTFTIIISLSNRADIRTLEELIYIAFDFGFHGLNFANEGEQLNDIFNRIRKEYEEETR